MRFSALAVALVSYAGSVGAAPEPAAPQCTRGAAAALGEIACEVARGVGGHARGALVVGALPTAEAGAAPAPELGARLAKLVAGALGSGTTAWPNAETSTKARGLGGGTKPVVVLESRVRGGRVEVTADVFVGRQRFWQRVRGARGGPVAHAFAERAIDGEVRSFLPKVPLVAREVRKVSGLDADVVALACGDLTGDGEPEIAAVGRQRVTLGRIRSDRFEAFASRGWSELAPVAPVPLREPIASAWIPTAGLLEIGSSDRQRALRLDATLQKLAALDARLPWPGGGCANLEQLAVRPELARCAGTDAPRGKESLGDPVDALGGGLVVAADGRARVVRAGRRASDATLIVTDGGQRVELANAGAQLALGDLDGDGAPEVVVSLNTLDAAADALVVYSWRGSALEERLRLPMPGGLRALGTCPARAVAMGPIVAATREALWLIR
jgi:hypothetical protein